MKIDIITDNLPGESVYLLGREDDMDYSWYIDSPWSFVNVVYKSGEGRNNPSYYISTSGLSLENPEDMRFKVDFSPTHHEARVGVRTSRELQNLPEWIVKDGDLYVGFLSDWVEYRDQEIIEELRKYGYNV